MSLQLGEIKGKKLLDLGCGAGEAAVYFAKNGADVTATDISAQMLDLVQHVSKRHGVEVKTIKSFSHHIEVLDNTYDIVYAANLLHHVDLDRTLAEITRVLKKGGIWQDEK